MKDPYSKEPYKLSEDTVDLLRAIGGGNDSAFRKFVGLWEKPLLAFFYRQTGDFHESQDLAQNVFRRVYRSASGFRGDGGSGRGWVFCLARRVLLNHWRTRKRKGLALPGDEFLQEMSSDFSEPRPVGEEEELFRKCLLLLPEKQRTVLLLRVREEMDYESMAEVLEESLANTKVLLHRARRKLRELYAKEVQR
ncbi:MAG: RNA polymerase sigma factor [Opitutales bacterium]|nr:RNA polymerase sigma factor [Opitutales bacterium]